MAVLPGFIGGAYESRSPNAASERCVNLYAEVVESHSDRQNQAYVLYGTPGYRPWARLPGPGWIRGLYTTSRGRAFCVVAERCYEIFPGGTWYLRGTMTIPPANQPSSQTGPVSMADNGPYLVVVDGSTNGGWTLKLANNTWQAIIESPTATGFTGARRVDFFDGFFVFDSLTQPGVIYISGLYDPLTDDPLDFATAESSPDGVVGHIVNNREWWIGGTRSMEIWYDIGGQIFPFAPIQGTANSAGLCACHSLQTLGNRVYWLSQTKEGQAIVVRNQGYEPVRISTHAIERTLRDIRVDDAVAYTQTWEGHSFYVLSVPASGHTWAFDTATDLWHERAFYNPTSGDLTRDLQMDLAQYHCFFANLHLLGGNQSTTIYQGDPTYYYHDQTPIVRDRVGWHVKDPGSLRLLYWALIELDMERGVGLDNALQPGQTPQAMLRWSDDGGSKWNDWRQADIGTIGTTRQRVIWRRLGRSRDRVPWVRITDPVKVALIGARFEVT